MGELVGLNLLRTIKGHFVAVFNLINVACYAEASFYLQQIFEKILKYQLYKIGCKVPIKTHNLQELLKMLKKHNIAYPLEIANIAVNISRWETFARYTDDAPPSLEELNNTYNILKSYCDTVIGYDIFTLQ